MLRLFITVLSFLGSVFYLYSQSPVLFVFEKNRTDISYPSWVQRSMDSTTADVFLFKNCQTMPCGYVLSDAKKQHLGLYSPKDLEQVLARFFSKKIRENKLDYHLRDSSALDFVRKSGPFGLWFFNVGGSFQYSKNWYSDRYDFNGTIPSSGANPLDLNFSAQKISERWRIGTFASVKRQKFATGIKRIEQNYDFDIAWRLGRHMAVGTSLGFADNNYTSLRKRLFTNASIEYNFVPYEEYFRRRCILYYTLGNSVYLADLQGFQAQELSDLKKNIAHSVGFGYAQVVPWGRISLSSSVEYSNRTGSIFANSNFEVYSIYSNLWFSTGVNLTEHLWIDLAYYFTHYYSDNKRNPGYTFGDDRTRTKSTSWKFSFGLQYFFGKTGKNIINPRMF